MYLHTVRKYRKSTRIIYGMEVGQNTTSVTTLIPDTCADCSRYIPCGKGPGLICCDAGSAEKGFIPGVGIVFKSKVKSEDYHDEMNIE